MKRDYFLAFKKFGYKLFDPNMIIQNLFGIILKADLKKQQENSLENSFYAPVCYSPISIYILFHNSQNLKYYLSSIKF